MATVPNGFRIYSSQEDRLFKKILSVAIEVIRLEEDRLLVNLDERVTVLNHEKNVSIRKNERHEISII